ncbi:hypothetical protein, partial [Methylophaga sp.]
VCKSNVWNIACPGGFVVVLNKRRATQAGARLPGAPAYSPSVDISVAFSATTEAAMKDQQAFG